MTASSDDRGQLSPAKRALLALDQLQSRVKRAEDAEHESIAIIGMAARFPGASGGIDGFWTVLRDGVDAIREVPGDRWDIDAYFDPDWEKPGKMNTRWGGFLDDVDAFDASFFGISRREAELMDPQQRILLEVAWAALEDACLPGKSLANASTGIYVGMSTNDYLHRMRRNAAGDPDAFWSSGNSFSMAAGRLAHFLGTNGPSLTVDTACSSSLVAVHLACHALRRQECSSALAGGVNLILTPETTISLTKAGMMASDGRCKGFDAAANGYVRGEGCGLVVLKRLSDAQADGDRIYALIRGSAVMHDGPSSGLTVPNGQVQERLIRQAFANAQTELAEASYLEAHGTGTALGDPIEMNALKAVFGGDAARRHPLRVGSVKSNIGHLEPAAGIAGLIKTVLALRQGLIPPHLHFKALNPNIDLAGEPIEVQTDLTNWPETGGPLIAGVSSFGFSGTNAHAVLAQATTGEPQPTKTDRPLHIIALSARTEVALRQSVERHLQHMQSDRSQAVADIAYSAGAGRSHFEHRAALVAGNRDDLERSLRSKNHLGSKAADRRPPLELAFVFGEGDVRPNAARALYDEAPAFRGALEQCDKILQPLLNVSLIEHLYGDVPEGERVAILLEPAIAQPALFAVAHGLAVLWQSWGIRPTTVLGRGAGEYGAAHFAGVMNLEDALKLAVERGRSMATLQEAGSSRDAALVTGAFEREALQINFAKPRIAIVSGFTGKPASNVDAAYWREQLQAPARYEEAVDCLRKSGCNVFVELGAGHGRDVTSGQGSPGEIWLTSLDRKRGDWNQVLDSLGNLYERGADVDWRAFDAPYSRRKLSLPAYPFQRQTYWFEERGRGAADRIDQSDAQPGENRLYRVEWQAQERSTDAGTIRRQGTWLVFADRTGLSQDLIARLRTRGETCVSVLPGLAFEQLDEQSYSVPPLDYAAYKTLLDEIRRDGSLKNIVHLWGLGTGPFANMTLEQLIGSQERICGSGIGLVRALAQDGDMEETSLWMVTAGAQKAAGEQDVVEPDQTPLWGLAGAVSDEFPKLHCRRVDLDPSASADSSLDGLLAELFNPDDEDQLAYRRGERYAARLVKIKDQGTSDSAPIRADGTYLITGGLSGVGLELAAWLVDRGARSLVLVARRKPSDAVSYRLERLRARGADIEPYACDVANEMSVKAMLQHVRSTKPAIRGVIHAAGILEDASLASTDWSRHVRVNEPKLIGSWNLHQQTLEDHLDFFVCCSSVAAIMGSPGQGSYAAANAFLDGLMHYRQSIGRPGLSINWGPWAETGMAASLPGQYRDRLQRLGVRFMKPKNASEDFGHALSQSAAQLAIVEVDRHGPRPATVGSRVSPFLSALIGSAPDEKIDSLLPLLLASISNADEADKSALLRVFLAHAIGELLRVDPRDIEPGRHLMEYGLDSLMVVSLAQRLHDDLGLPIAPNEIFTKMTIDALSAHLVDQLRPDDPVPAAKDAHAKSEAVSTATPAAGAFAWAAVPFSRDQERRPSGLAKSSSTAHGPGVAEPDAHDTSLPDKIPIAERGSKPPLSVLQELSWAWNTAQPARPQIILRQAILIGGPLDLAVLERGLNEIVRRHETLRTQFDAEIETASQSILPFLAVSIEAVDLTTCDPDELPDQIRSNMGDLVNAAFDLGSAPLFRCRCLRLGEDQHLLLLPMHHIITDGRSFGLLMNELASYCREGSNGTPHRLPDLPIQFADFAIWERSWMREKVWPRQIEFWQRQLDSEWPILELPGQLPRKQTHYGPAASSGIVLDESASQGLFDLSRTEGVTPFMTILAAVNTLMAGHAGQTDIAVTSPTAGRPHKDVQHLIGYFANRVILRNDLSGNPSFRELLARVRGVVTGAFAHQDVPINVMRQALEHGRQDRQLRIQLNMVDYKDPMPSEGGLTMTGGLLSAPETAFDLSFYVRGDHRGLLLRLVYNADLFDHDIGALLLAHIKALITRTVETPDVPLSSLIGRMMDQDKTDEELGTIPESAGGWAPIGADRPIVPGTQTWKPGQDALKSWWLSSGDVLR